VLLSLDAEQIAALIKLGQDLLKRWCRPEFCSNAETSRKAAPGHRHQPGSIDSRLAVSPSAVSTSNC
jgi:hypothetical protein